MARKASTKSNSANIKIQDKLTKAVEKRSHYVQNYWCMGVVLLSVFRGNFVLAKVSLGLISVRCTELRGVRFSQVRNV